MKRFAAVIALLALGLAVFASIDPPRPRADLTFIDSQDFISLDPQRVSYMQDIRAVYCLYEGLTRCDIHTPGFDPVPALAESWTISPDRRTYTFRLRENARWSNADPVRAADIVYSWKRALLPDTAADYTSLFFKIRNADAFFKHRTERLAEYAKRPAAERTPDSARALRAETDAWFHEHVGLRAPDDRTLIVELERPVAYFLDLVAFAPFAPVHPGTVERFVSLDPATGEVRQDQGFTKPPHQVGNGPLVLTSWRFKRSARFDANPHYHTPSALRSRSVEVIPIEDQNTGILAFKTGAADWHCDVNADYIPEMLAQVARGERDDFTAFPTFGTYFWNFNCTPNLTGGAPNPFADARVRRAFALSVNKRDLVDKVKRGGERVASSLVPPGSIGGYTPPTGLAFNPDAARRELADAGWKPADNAPPTRADGAVFPEVSILVSNVSYHRDIAQALARMWQEHLGVRCRIEVNESRAFKEKLRARDYMISRGGWWGDYGDPTTFLDAHRTGDGNNDRGYSSPEYDALLDRAENATDPAERSAILANAERLIVERDLPVVPLWQYNFYYLHRPPERHGSPNPGGLKGITTHPRLLQYYWQLEVVR